MVKHKGGEVAIDSPDLKQLEELHPEESFKLIIIAMRALGTWPEKSGDVKYTIYAATMVIIFFVVYAASQFCSMWMHITKIQEVASYCILGETVVGIIKAYLNYTRIDKMKAIIKELSDDFFRPKTAKQRALLKNAMARVNYVFYSCYLVTFLLTIFMGMTPFMLMETHGRTLPVKTWFPYDYTVSPYYELTYLYIMVSAYYVFFFSANTDIMVVALMIQIGAQCDILCDCLENLFELSNDKNFYDLNERKNEQDHKKTMTNNLKYCIQFYCKIKSYSKEVVNLYGLSVLVVISTSVYNICTTLFLASIISGGTKPMYFKMICFLFLVVYEIFIYCWFGNEIIYKSSKISTSAYKCDWLEQSQSFKKTLTIFMHQSEKPLKLLVGHIFVVSLNGFISITKCAWSYYTTVSAIYKKGVH